MTLKLPSLYCYSFSDNLIPKINYLYLLGFSKEELIKITVDFPAIYSYSYEKMNNAIKILKQFGYDDFEIKKNNLSITTCIWLFEW